MTTNWTTLYVKLNGKGEQSETQMKRIGNINPKTGDVNLYSEGNKYYESGDLYYVNLSGDYQRYHK